MSVGGPHRSAIALIALVLAVSAVAAPAGAGPRPAARSRAAVGGAVSRAHIPHRPSRPIGRRAASDCSGSRPIPIMVRFDVIRSRAMREGSPACGRPVRV